MSASQSYHTLTNYSPERPWHEPLDDPRLVTGFEICAPQRRPADFKTYAEHLPSTPLPSELPHHGISAARVLGGAAGPDRGELTLPELARLLYYSAGVVRYRETPNGRIHYRAAGSAGNRHPLEVYAVTGGLDGLPAGVWHHDPIHHALQGVAPAPLHEGPTFLVITGVPWRSAWRYAERAWRHLWWDCGTMLSHLFALTQTLGVSARLRLSFPDPAVATLVGADGTDEFPLAVVVLGAGEPAFAAHAGAATGTLAGEPIRFPLITATQHATEPAGPGWSADTGVHPHGAWAAMFRPAGSQSAPGVGMANGSPPGISPAPPDHRGTALEDVVLQRGSARRFRQQEALPADAVAWALAVAARPIPWDAGPSLMRHHLVAHHVDGLAPGTHRWNGSEPELVGAGDQRQATYRFCLNTDLARDAALVVVHCADLNGTLHRLGERGYRAMNLEAGYTSGRLHLAAHALGYAASGLVFNDELTPAFLHTDTTGLLATGLGVAAYHALPGGKPLQPSRLRSR